MTDDIQTRDGEMVGSSNHRERRRGEWYFAGLCVECRVCDAGVGELCRGKDGRAFFSADWRHHYWRYRDVRHLIGRQLPGKDFVDRETWKAERTHRSEPVNPSPIAA